MQHLLNTPYGMSASKFRALAPVSVEDAQKMVEKYKHAYPAVHAMLQQLRRTTSDQQSA